MIKLTEGFLIYGQGMVRLPDSTLTRILFRHRVEIGFLSKYSPNTHGKIAIKDRLLNSEAILSAILFAFYRVYFLN